MLLDKPLEYWLTLAGAALYVASRDAEKAPLVRRMVKLAAGGLMAAGTSRSMAEYTGLSEGIVAAAIMGFGVLLLDLISALLSDRDFIKSIVTARMGGKKDE